MKNERHSHNFQDLTGLKFGELTVVEFSHIDNRMQSRWLCKCDCGAWAVVTASKLKSGHTKTCGHANVVSAKRKEGYFPARDHPRLYGVWCAMKSRCYNPNSNSYSVYGARGIQVCDEWMLFANFCEWALANGYDCNAPTGKCTLDRINVNGDYEPSNCRWADSTEQANNKTNNRYATINGETDTMANWIRKFGLKRGTVMQRLHRGDSPEEALRPIPTSYAQAWDRRKNEGK